MTIVFMGPQICCQSQMHLIKGYLLNIKLEEQLGCTFGNSVGITRHLKITQESSNRDRVKVIRPVQIRLCRHASRNLADFFRHGAIILHQRVCQSIRPKLDCCSKTGVYSMADIDAFARMFFGAMPEWKLQLKRPCFFTSFGKGVVDFRNRGLQERIQLVIFLRIPSLSAWTSLWRYSGWVAFPFLVICWFGVRRLG